MVLMQRRTALVAVLALGNLGRSARAQPVWLAGKPISIIVPFPAGGVTDVLARTFAARLADNMKATVLVDNRPGGAAQIAMAALRQAPADGHTLFIGDTGAFALNPSLYRKLNYDTAKDLVPLALLATAPTMLLVPAASPYRTAADLLAAIKSKPGSVNMASQGSGTIGHLFVEILQLRTSSRVNHVPYKGSAPALQDMLGGHVDAMLDPVVTSAPYVKEGKLRALAVALASPSPQFPGVPTFAEVGMQDLALTPWFGIAMKAGTPPKVVGSLQQQIALASQSPEFLRRLAELSLQPNTMQGSEFATFIGTETSRWAKVIKDADIRLE